MALAADAKGRAIEVRHYSKPAEKYLTFVIPAKAGHAVKLKRYPCAFLDGGSSPA